jgi:hypothetical protein
MYVVDAAEPGRILQGSNDNYRITYVVHQATYSTVFRPSKWWERKAEAGEAPFKDATCDFSRDH